MGKPAAADLKLGLATAPVLFACEKVIYLKLIEALMIHHQQNVILPSTQRSDHV
jgi:geranylgeranyl pyrophosphate synthase